LTGTPEDALLIALGSAVSDGSTIDWDQAERNAVDPEKQNIVRGMRRLADVVAAHRSSGANGAEVAAPVSPARNWRHIVLFEPIGAGAFGTVYRGWDPTLDRDVAVKLFPKSSNLDPASPLEEARHLARVRHANVVVVYGADRDGDEAGIWMEYIEGHTLAEMIRQAGPMSAREVTGIGLDLCRALAALHGAGLLHRDIKPHNVMREFGGRIVLMDFSGSQAVASSGSASVNSGTPLFMAPELFGNGAASFASEVYSLGILLFFLLSGRLPIEAATVAALKIAHAAGRRNRLSDLRPDVPSSLVHVIERAIATDPAARYQTAGEFEHALATASGSHTVVVGNGAAARSSVWMSRPSGKTWLWLAAGMVLSAVVAAAAVSRWRDDARPAVLTRFTIGPPFTSGSWPRISPDGRYVTFGALVEGRNRFWVRAVDEVDGRPLINTTANESPFWSPDSAALCFFDDGKLKRIPIGSGNSHPEVLADAPGPHGGDWSGQAIVFSRADGLYRIALADHGAVSQLTALDSEQGDYQHAWPEFLPDGRSFLFVIRSSRQERSGIYVASIDGDAPRRLMPAFSRVVYADSHLLFVRQGVLMAQRFDPATATLEREPTMLSDRVKHHAASDGAFDASNTGVLIFGQTPSDPSTRLMLFDGRGRELRALTPTGHYRHPRFSPDGRRVVAEKVDSDERNVDLWLYDIERGGATRLTNGPAPDVRPTWSPDGQRVVFSSKRREVYDVFTKTVNTADLEIPLITEPGDKFVEDWSADGRFLSGTVLRSGLWVFPLDPAAKPWMTRNSERGGTWQSEFSPDGRWLAYTSFESGSAEVYVEPFPATGTRWQVSADGGGEPHWRRGGRELVYLAPRGLLMAVSGERGWEHARARPLFHLAVPDIAGSGDYTVSPTGEHIVVNTFIADPVVPPIDVVVNWMALLKR
jgi:Tol biopolymer transport system component